jgi:hypothetical protein
MCDIWKHGEVADDLSDAARDGAPPVLCGDACCQADDGLLCAGLSDVAVGLATAGFVALWQGRSLTPVELLPGNVEQASMALRRLLLRDAPRWTRRAALWVSTASRCVTPGIASTLPVDPAIRGARLTRSASQPPSGSTRSPGPAAQPVVPR